MKRLAFLKLISVFIIVTFLFSGCNLTRLNIKRSLHKNNFNKTDQLKRFLNNMNSDERKRWYIKTYSDFAIQQMKKYKIPASIILSQGLLESGAGVSTLALKSNNHFGIKCKGSWTGKTIYANDDAPDECFRAYPSVLESYKDHSDFLRKNWRYHELFDLKITDYKGLSLIHI